MAALWGWSNFGGLGARTRRGGGSLFCPDLAPPSHEPDDLRKWFSEWLERIDYEPSSTVPDWPVFKRSIYLGPVQSNPYSAWEKSIDVLYKFRQGEEIGRYRGSSGRQGRSRWPEADSIRRITGQNSPRHKPSPEKPEKAFPRAQLGLPIIMRFKDSKDGDPGSVTLSPSLKGEKAERMASPLILKVLALNNNKYLPICLCLGTPALEGLSVEGGRTKESYGASSLSDPSFANYPGSPMSGRSDRGSALEAFLAFACENGFKEVSK
jgi:CRISPR-associated protein Cmr1